MPGASSCISSTVLLSSTSEISPWISKVGLLAASATKKGACSSHNGVKDWYGATAVKVWANKDTQTYHCPSDQWYGKTPNGSYMSESDAKAQGFHADHGKACQ